MYKVMADVGITEFNCTNNFSSPPSLLNYRVPSIRTYCNSLKPEVLITSHSNAYHFVSSEHRLTFFENLMPKAQMQMLRKLRRLLRNRTLYSGSSLFLL